MNALNRIAAEVRALQPGQSLTVDSPELREIPPFEYGGARWTPEDQVLDKIIGSAYEYDVTADPLTGHVTFHRHSRPAPDGAYRWVSPDRRHLVELCPDGLLRPYARRLIGA